MQFASYKGENLEVMPEATSPRSHNEMGREQKSSFGCNFFLSPSIQSSHLSNLSTTFHPHCCHPSPSHCYLDQLPLGFTKTLPTIHCNQETNKIQVRSHHSLLKTCQWLPIALKINSRLLRVSGPFSVSPACSSSPNSCLSLPTRSSTLPSFLNTICALSPTYVIKC